MSEYRLTAGRGTSLLGRCAGLRRAAEEEETGYGVEVHQSRPTDPTLLDKLPALALVPFSEPLAVSRSRMLGRSSDEGHAVVVLDGFADGTFSIADPATGLQRWSEVDLQRR